MNYQVSFIRRKKATLCKSLVTQILLYLLCMRKLREAIENIKLQIIFLSYSLEITYFHFKQILKKY